MKMCLKLCNNLLRHRKINNSRFYNSISAVLNAPESGDKVTIKGWVKGLRVQKKHLFLDINDGTSNDRLQVMLHSKMKPVNLTWGSSVEIQGNMSISPRGQPELIGENIKVIGECVIMDGYPFNPRQTQSPDYLREYLHLRHRTKNVSSMLRVRNRATMAVHEYFQSQNFTLIHSPILTSNDCEGAGETFKTEPESNETLKSMANKDNLPEDYFGSKTFLTVSGQLHLEAIARGLGNVYTFGPTFRAENSKSRLHLSEFYMAEAELAFCQNINELKEHIEKLVKYVYRSVLDKCENDLSVLHDERPVQFPWLEKEFVTLTYDEAVKLLIQNEDKTKVPFSFEQGLTKDHELLLVKLCGDVPTFIVEFPKVLKPFYMKSCINCEDKVEALDLLTPLTGELAGGSLREDNYDKLNAILPSQKLNWYLELRKFGNIPTGGFGLGFERLLQYLCNINNIKDTIPFPRWPHNCSM